MKYVAVLFLFAFGANAEPFASSCTAYHATCSIGALSGHAYSFGPGDATVSASYDGFVSIDSPSGTIFGNYSIGGFGFLVIDDFGGYFCPQITITQGTSVFNLQDLSSFNPAGPPPGQCLSTFPFPDSQLPLIGSPLSLPFSYTAGTPLEISASISAGFISPDSLFPVAEGSAFVLLNGFTDENGNALDFQVLPEPVMWPAVVAAFALLLWRGRKYTSLQKPVCLVQTHSTGTVLDCQ